jgi:hypothetical protein
VSPTKSRRPSPSKIPISAEYLPLGRGGSGSTEFLGRGSTEQLVRGPSLEHLLRGSSTEHLVRAATEHALRQGSTEHLIRGSTDRLVRGRGSVEQLARGSTERPVSTHSGSSLSASSQQQSPENFKNPARLLNLHEMNFLLKFLTSTQCCGTGSRMFLALLDLDPNPFVSGTDPDPSIIKQK